jgi:hypothetical protein
MATHASRSRMKRHQFTPGEGHVDLPQVQRFRSMAQFGNLQSPVVRLSAGRFSRRSGSSGRPTYPSATSSPAAINRRLAQARAAPVRHSHRAPPAVPNATGHAPEDDLARTSSSDQSFDTRRTSAPDRAPKAPFLRAGILPAAGTYTFRRAAIPEGGATFRCLQSCRTVLTPGVPRPGRSGLPQIRRGQKKAPQRLGSLRRFSFPACASIWELRRHGPARS